MLMIRVVVIGVTLMMFTGCAVGPDYVRPAAPVATKFKEAKGRKIMDAKNKDWKIAEPRDRADRGKWWRVFHDSRLDELEEQLNVANQNIVNAYYNFHQACALVAEAEASFLPSLTGSASLTREKSGGGINVNNNVNLLNTSSTSTASASSGAGTGKIGWVHSIAFNATWQIDIWGAVRRAVEASIAGAQASSALLSSTRLSMQSSLATYYFQLRGLDADQRLLDATVKGYKKVLKLTQNEYASGTVSQADVIQARSQVESAESAAINNGILRAQYEHAIAVLVGVPAGNFSITPRKYKVAPPPIPLVVATTLLERRPDIAQAERLMAQANAQIGVAVAAFYPTFNLTGSASDVATGLGHWFSIPAFAWAYGGQLMETILDGGLRNAQVAAANAAYCASVASYRQVVLAAFQNVEDNLASLRILNKQIIVQRKATADAIKALEIVVNQYKSGIVPFINVIVQEVATYAAEKNEVDINYQRMTSAVGLITAMGGSWDGVVCA